MMGSGYDIFALVTHQFAVVEPNTKGLADPGVAVAAANHRSVVDIDVRGDRDL